METGSEITAKIRSAIKAKLVELGAYVDEELPDYIMVMIANKKTKEQMTNDLNLFLGKNSEIFTDWVHNVLDRLQAISQKSSKADSRVDRSSSDREKKKSKSASKKTNVAEREASDSSVSVKACSSKTESIEKSDNFCHKNKEFIRKETISVTEHKHRGYVSSTVKSINEKIRPSYDGRVRVKANSDNVQKEFSERCRTKYDDENRSPKHNEKLISTKVESNESHYDDFSSRFSSRTGKTNQKIVTVRPMKRKSPSPDNSALSPARKRRSVVGQVVNRQVEETDYELSIRALAVNSTVRVTERKIKVPPNMQPKPSIFLKALNEANASVSRRHRLILSDQEFTEERKKESVRRIITEEPADECYEPKEDANSDPQPYVPQYVPTPIKPVINEDTRRIEYNKDHEGQKTMLDNITSSSSTNTTVDVQEMLIVETEDMINPPETRFFVTLEGVDTTFVKKIKPGKLSDQGEDGGSDAEDEMMADFVEETEDIDQKTYHGQSQSVQLTAFSQKSNHESDEALGIKNTDVDYDIETVSDSPEMVSEECNDDEASSLNDAASPLAQVKEVKIFLDEEEEEHKRLKGKIIEEASPATAKENIVTYDDDDEPMEMNDKIKERCKYWPACKLSDTCPYHHPTMPCRSFPVCRFGDRCLFIHPKCRFDAFCTNKRCPFSHSAAAHVQHLQRPESSASKTVIKTITSANAVPCKFGNRCANASCPFKHPKVCVFGANCFRPDCAFSHPQKKASAAARPSAVATQKFKWVAPGAVSNRRSGDENSQSSSGARPELVATNG